MKYLFSKELIKSTIEVIEQKIDSYNVCYMNDIALRDVDENKHFFPSYSLRKYINFAIHLNNMTISMAAVSALRSLINALGQFLVCKYNIIDLF